MPSCDTTRTSFYLYFKLQPLRVCMQSVVENYVIITSLAGVVGGLLGWGVSVYRRVPPHAFSLSLAANFAVVSGSFLCTYTTHTDIFNDQLCLLGIRKVVHSVLIEKDARSLPFSSTNRQLLASVASYTSSVASGGLTGALTSLISREKNNTIIIVSHYLFTGYGLRSILMTSLGGMGTGLCAQAGYDKLLEWRKRKAMQIYHEDITGKKSRPFEEWTLVSPIFRSSVP